MASTSTSVSRRTGCAAWCWSACAPMGTRSWSPSVMASENRSSRGPSCCAISSGAACEHRWSLSATAHSASGVRYATSSQRAANSDTGFHKIANILHGVPNSLRPKVKAALHTIMNAENK
jgi:hypothetical protein